MKCVVVADDLTGANATCSLLKKVGLSTASLFKLEENKEYETDVVAYSTDSRAIEENEAYLRTNNSTKLLKRKNILLYNKRIDSTLRGNIGKEIEGMLDALKEENRIAIILPAYPDSGRVVVNKTMIVNGILLEHSDAGKDPKTPIKTSNVEKIIKEQTNLNVAYITLNDINKSITELSSIILEKAQKNKILIFDAFTNNDIIKVVETIVKLELKIITVDPGPLTMYYAKEIQKKKNIDEKILLVIGSATQTTKLQIEYILQQEDIFLIRMRPNLFFELESRQEEIERVCKEVRKGIASYDLVLITTTPIGDDIPLDLEIIASKLKLSVDDISKIIANTLTEAAKTILLEITNFKGIYSSGGDITLALLEKLESIGVEIKDEVLPLAAYGRILEGKVKNLKLVSKGGMVGKEDAIKLCLQKIKSDI